MLRQLLRSVQVEAEVLLEWSDHRSDHVAEPTGHDSSLSLIASGHRYPSPVPRIYTKTGDDGTTGLLYGGRISKADLTAEAYGSVDEAVAAIGLARSFSDPHDVSALLIRHKRELFVVRA